MRLLKRVAIVAGWNIAFFAGTAAVLLYVGSNDNDPDEYREGRKPGKRTDSKMQKEVDKKLKLRNKSLQKSTSKEGEVAPLNKHGLVTGQIPAKKWIVLDLGKKPSQKEYDLSNSAAKWSLEFTVNGQDGSGEKVTIKMDDLDELKWETFDANWNCVTGWTYSGIKFKGVPLLTLLEYVKTKMKDSIWSEDWKYLYQTSPEGYSVPVYREDLHDAFLCIYVMNEESGEYEMIDYDHGGIRFVFPSLFGWKSCKWVTKVDISTKYQKGFWERIGCHARGRVKYNERWAPQAGLVWTFLSNANKLMLMVFGQEIGTRMMQNSGYYLGFFVDTIKTTLHLSDTST